MASRKAGRKSARRQTARRAFRPCLELLEDRTAPAVFNVPSGTEPGMNIGSLSAAIMLADSNSDTSNIINVAPDTYTVVNLAIVAPPTKTLIIVGQGDGVMITAGRQGRVFTIDANVAFEDVTITGGLVKAASAQTPAMGGGLLVDGGQVTLSNVTVTHNTVQGAVGSSGGPTSAGLFATNGGTGGAAYGGGMYLASGSLTLTDSTVADNRALGGKGGPGGGVALTGRSFNATAGKGGQGGTAAGAGLYMATGKLLLTNTTIRGNRAQGGTGGPGGSAQGKVDFAGVGGAGGSASGGGAALADGTATMVSSPVTSNNARGGAGGMDGAAKAGAYVADANGGGPGRAGGAASGGGLYLGSGTLTLFSSTIGANLAQGGPAGLLTRANATLSRSIRGGGGTGGPGQGGGLFINDGTLTLVACQVKTNRAKGADGGPFYGGVTNLGAAIRGGNGGGGAGGGIYQEAGTAKLFGGSIAGNSATGGTGANGPNGASATESLFSKTSYGGFSYIGKGGDAGRDGGNGGEAVGGGVYLTAGSLSVFGAAGDPANISSNRAIAGDGGSGGRGANGGNAAGGQGGLYHRWPLGQSGIAGQAGGAGGDGGDVLGGGCYVATGALTLANVTLQSDEVQGGSGGHGGAAGNGGNGADGKSDGGRGGGGGVGGFGGSGGNAYGGGIYLSVPDNLANPIGKIYLSGGALVLCQATGGHGGAAGNGGNGGAPGGGQIAAGEPGSGGSGGNGGYGGNAQGGGIYVAGGAVGVPYRQTIVYHGLFVDGLDINPDALPAPLVLTPSVGATASNEVTIAGTPTQPGTYSFFVAWGGQDPGVEYSFTILALPSLTLSNTSIAGTLQAGIGGTAGKAGSGYRGNTYLGQPGMPGITDGASIHGASNDHAAGQATQLIVSPMPPTVLTDMPFTDPVYVVAEDANGNVDPYFNSGVTIQMGNNPDKATIEGTVNETATNGVAVFSGDPEISTEGNGDTLIVTTAGNISGGEFSISTNLFDVVPDYEINFYVGPSMGQPQNFPAGHAFVQIITNVPGPRAGNKNLVFGFYPLSWDQFTGGPGMISGIDMTHPWNWRISYVVSAAQYNAANNYIQSNLPPNPVPNWYLFSTNCVWFIQQVAAAANLSLPDFDYTFGPLSVPDPETMQQVLSTMGNGAVYHGGIVEYNDLGTLPNNTPDPPFPYPDLGSVELETEEALQDPPALANSLDLAFQGVTLTPVSVGVGQTLTISFTNVDLTNALLIADFGVSAPVYQSLSASYAYESTGIWQAQAIVIDSGAVDVFSLEVDVGTELTGNSLSISVPSPPPNQSFPNIPPASDLPPAPLPGPTVATVSPATGLLAGGTVVTITGANLNNATAVAFGSTIITNILSITESQIVVNSPPGIASTVDVTVITASGTSPAAPADQFTFGPGAAPTITSLDTMSGPLTGGTTVTIQGTNFAGSSPPIIDFGKNPATVLNYSTTQIVATSPAGTPGTVDVTVTAGGETSGISHADQFIYVAAPSVTGGSQETGPVAGGTTLTITGADLADATAVDFGTNAATIVSDDDTKLVVISPPSSAGTVDVTVTTAGGTSATSSADQFSYVPAPTVTVISPSSGPESGDTQVIIAGTNLSSATAVAFGSTLASSFTVVSDTELVAYSPAGSAGPVDITVTTPSGTSATSAADQFTYCAPPTITGVSPPSGPADGGTSVTISGSGFTGTTEVDFGAIAVTSFVVNSDSQITVTSPAGSAGTVDVSVVAPGGTSAAVPADQFTYGAGAAPTVSYVTPDNTSYDAAAGPVAGGTTVTIFGTNFAGSTAPVVDFGANVATVVSYSTTQIVAVSPPGAAGPVDITITTPYGTSAAWTNDQFTYDDMPTVTSINPASGPMAGATAVTVTGTGLLDTTSVAFGATPASSVSVESDTQLVAYSPGGDVGAVDVTVTTPSGTSATSAADQFTYLVAPTITGISPASGPADGGTSVTITGSGFTDATEVDFGGTPGTNLVVDSDSQITITSPAGSAGTVDVAVVAPGGTSAPVAADEFTYDAGAAPSVSSIAVGNGSASYAAGPVAGGTTVTIDGSNFAGSTAPVVDFGTNAATVVSYSTTQIVAISPAGTGGTIDVTVTTPYGTSATSTNDEFTYEDVPTITSISPASGGTGGDTAVTITGTGLLTASAVSFGSTPASSFYSESDSQLVAYSPSGTLGTVDVTVTAMGGTSATSAGDQFTYQGAPTVTGISPDAGPVAGSTAVTITGTNLAGATAVYFGKMAATNIISDTAGELVVDSPAGSLGTVNVTVVTGASTSATSSADQFTYAGAPTITGIAPANGPTPGGTWVVLTGTNLEYASAVDFGANAGTIESDSATQLVAMSPAGDTGAVDLTVTTPSGTSATSAADQFTYAAVPTITAISPANGPDGGGTTVTIIGTDLANAIGVEFGDDVVSNFTSDTADQIVLNAPPGTDGTLDVTVITAGGTSAPSLGDEFTYGAGAAPSITSVAPAAGDVAGSTTVTITGSNFAGTPTVDFGSTQATVTAFSTTQITALSPAGAAGVVDITVTTAEGTSVTSVADEFTYLATPVVTAISPATGSTAGGITVTITGSGFTDASEIDFGTTAATNFTIDSDSQITVVSPAGAAGTTVDVTVTTPTGTSGTSAADQFTYVAAAPTVAGITPNVGPQAGGTSVTITGANLGGATAVDFGANAGTITSDSDTQIVATAPAGAAGTVDVTVVTLGGTSATSAADQFTYLAASFGNVSAPTITYGAATTVVSGQFGSNVGSVPVPAGETVQVTIDGVTQSATLDNSDDFSTTFDTSTLGAAASPYTIGFAYGGDANFSAATGDSTLTVNKAQLTVTADNQQRLYGQSNPTLTYSITGFANSENATTAGITGTPTLGTAATPSSPVGAFPITVDVSGMTAANYDFTAAASELTVDKAHLTVTANNQSRVYGQADPTFTYTITGFQNGETLASSGATGTPVLSSSDTATSPPGQDSISVGQGTLAAANYDFPNLVAGTLTITQDGTKVQMQSSANPASVGETITLAATVTAAPPGSGTPGGSVTFLDGTTPLGSATLVGGVATLPVAFQSVATHSLTASYGGDADFTGDASPSLLETVLLATKTSLTLSSAKTVFGQALTLRAAVAPAVTNHTAKLTGMVTFFAGSTPLGSAPLKGGAATLTTSAASDLAVGTYALTAVYGNDPVFGPSTSPAVTETVSAANTQISLTGAVSAVFGQTVTLTAHVTAQAPSTITPSGTVTFMDGTSSLETIALTGGTAKLAIATLAVGKHALTAVFTSAPANDMGSTSAVVHATISKAATKVTVTASAKPAVLGETVTLTATVNVTAPGAATPTGIVTFKDGTKSLGTVPVVNGVATLATTSLAVGTDSLTASYGGDGDTSSSSATLSEPVSKVTTTVDLSASANPVSTGQPVTLTAQINLRAPGVAVPTGTVTFKDGATVVGTAKVANGTATIQTAKLAVGSHKLTAVYGGDSDCLGSTSATWTETIDALGG